MSALTVTLPGLPPTLNHAYQGDGRGGRRLTKTAERWMDGAVKAIRSAANCAAWQLPPATAWCVTVVFTARDIYKWDVDNRMKLLGDALHQALHTPERPIDDRYIVAWHSRKVRGSEAQTQIIVDLAE